MISKPGLHAVPRAAMAVLAAALAAGCTSSPRPTPSPATARATATPAGPATPAAPVVAGVSGTLSAVSCTAAACMAVGSYGKTSTGMSPTPEPVEPLAELWDGTRWHAERPPVPRNAAESMTVPRIVLTSVSCSTATACVAVGAYSVGTVTTAFSDSWNGSRWTVSAVPTPRAATSTVLNQVSCASAADCTAVGAFTRRADGILSSTEPGAVPLAEQWDGRTWTVQDGPENPVGAQGGYLSSVSCSSPASCTAVGATLDTASAATSSASAFAASWDGRNWSAKRIDSPDVAASTVLAALSCIAPDACTAIGYAASRMTVSLMTETWDGRKWRALAAGTSSGSDVSLTDLACSASAACVGVGSVVSGGRTQPAASSLQNGSWAQRPPRDPVGAQVSSFSGVSCASDGCMAVGRAIPSTTVAMSQWWSGRTWAVEPVPMPTA